MKRIILLLLCASLCQAASVTIAESAYPDASGRLATGTITISWPSFSNGVSNIAAGSTTVAVTNGVMSVSLVANETADPPFNYTASFRLQTASYSQQWKVPAEAGPLTIQRVTWSSNSPVTIPLANLSRVGALAGDLPYYNGLSFGALRIGTHVTGEVLTINTGLAGKIEWLAPTGGSGTPGGSANSIQYKSSSAFGGILNATGTRKFVTQISSGTPTFDVLQAGDIPALDYQPTLNFTPLNRASNLSDLASASTARTNLGLGTAATSAATAFEVPLTFAARLNRSVNTIDLATGIVTPGSCGDTTHSCSLTVDTYGRVTGATNNTIAAGTGDAATKVTTTFSATPTFTANANTATSFFITLTGNVTSSTLASATTGQILTFNITQDGSGSRAFVPPTNVLNMGTIGSGAAETCTQTFVFDGTNAQALGPMLCTGGTPGIKIPGSSSGTMTIAAPASGGGTATFFAGSDTVVGKATADTLTNKIIDGSQLVANSVPSSKMAVVNTRRTGCIVIGSNNAAAAIDDADLGPQSRQYLINSAQTLVEITVAADAGTPNIILGRSRAGSIASLTSSALATAPSGGIACSKATAVTGLDGATTCSATLQNTGLNVGDWITLVSGTAGGTAKEMTACFTTVVN